MQDNVSPEERLLRLIRRTPRQPSKKVAQEETSLRKDSDKRLTLSGISNLGKIKEHFSFNLINRVFLASFLILGVYLLVDFLITAPGKIEKRISGFKETKGTALEVPVETAAGLKPVSYYIQPVKSKNLFTATASETRQALPSPSFMEMVSKLKLQGIISGPNPQAVIKDTETKQTYFLSPGERIGGIELKQILPGKVKLNYYGQEVELAL